MVFSASKKDQSAEPSNSNGLDISRILSAEEGPTGEDRRTGDTAVYNYYIQTVHPFSASIFFVACTVFAVGLTLPRKLNLLQYIDIPLTNPPCRIYGQMVA